ncbi:MAG TPA: bifunctional nuclease family protein [Chthoniobacterales bacterium]|jgi:bifunctional DNase/RNase|nr:bifunctional nuclease family protein [Chthoniobacterales bacterium]
MSKPVVEVQIRAVGATSGGFAVFLGDQDKAFVIFADQSVGAAIVMFMQGTQKERPLTHDLLANILRALAAKIERVIINELKHETYFARLVLSAENELKQKKMIEIDARPSDCIALATAQRAPIYVSRDVWDQVEDMRDALPSPLPMGLGTKNRQKQTADICKQHLREKYRDKLGLVEEFIVEFEGAPKNCDVTRWGQFTDIKDIKKEMLKRLEAHFEKWLDP